MLFFAHKSHSELHEHKKKHLTGTTSQQAMKQLKILIPVLSVLQAGLAVIHFKAFSSCSFINVITIVGLLLANCDMTKSENSF